MPALPALRSLSVARRSSGAVSVLIARNGHRGRKGVMSEVGATINCLSAGLSNLNISADLCKCPTIEMSKLEREINNGREIMTRHYELTGPVTQPPPGPVSRVRPRLSLARSSRHPAPGPNYTECHLANLAGPDPGTNNLHTKCERDENPGLIRGRSVLSGEIFSRSALPGPGEGGQL